MDQEAARVANHLWRFAGFAPTTDPQSAAEFQVYREVYGRVRAWMHAQGITPATMRGSLHALGEYARTEGEQLYTYVAQGATPCGGMAWVLNSPAACQAYVMAISLSIQGTLSADAEGQERGRERPQWQTRGHPDRRGDEGRRGDKRRRGPQGHAEHFQQTQQRSHRSQGQGPEPQRTVKRAGEFPVAAAAVSVEASEL